MGAKNMESVDKLNHPNRILYNTFVIIYKYEIPN